MVHVFPGFRFCYLRSFETKILNDSTGEFAYSRATFFEDLFYSEIHYQSDYYDWKTEMTLL